MLVLLKATHLTEGIWRRIWFFAPDKCGIEQIEYIPTFPSLGPLFEIWTEAHNIGVLLVCALGPFSALNIFLDACYGTPYVFVLCISLEAYYGVILVIFFS